MSTSTAVKYQWYQSNAKVMVDIPIKNIQQENIEIYFKPHQLSVILKNSAESYKITINLAEEVIPEQCQYKLKSRKIEISLAKRAQVEWKTIEKIVAVEPVIKKALNPYSKNWDAIVSDELKGQEMENTNSFFTRIYSDDDDDARRAMIKSYYESNGTVLNMNWKEVGKKKVEMFLPDDE